MGKKSWLAKNVGWQEVALFAGLGIMAAGGALMDSPLVGLVIPGGVLVLMGLAPLRRLV